MSSLLLVTNEKAADDQPDVVGQVSPRLRGGAGRQTRSVTREAEEMTTHQGRTPFSGTGVNPRIPRNANRRADDVDQEEEGEANPPVLAGEELGEEELHELDQVSDYMVGRSQQELVDSLRQLHSPEHASMRVLGDENSNSTNRASHQHQFARISEESLRDLSSSDRDQGWREAYQHLDQVLRFLADPGEIGEVAAAHVKEQMQGDSRQPPDPAIPPPSIPTQFLTVRRAFLHNLRYRKQRDRWVYLLYHETRARDGTKIDKDGMRALKQTKYRAVVAALNALKGDYIDLYDYHQFEFLILYPGEYSPARTGGAAEGEAERLRTVQLSENRFLTKRQRRRTQRRVARAELGTVSDARPAAAPLTVSQIAAEMNRQRQEQLAKSRRVERGRRAWNMYPKDMNLTARIGYHPSAASFYYLGSIDLGSLNPDDPGGRGGGSDQAGGSEEAATAGGGG